MDLRTTGPWRVSPIAFGPIAFVAIFAISEIAARAHLTAGFCIVKELFGIRCIGCGVTTSIAALAGGDWTSAVGANIAGPIVLAVFAAQLACLGVFLCRPQHERLLFRVVRRTDYALLVSLLAAWLWHTVVD